MQMRVFLMLLDQQEKEENLLFLLNLSREME